MNALVTFAGYTFRQIVRQPVFAILITCFAFMTLFSLYLPLFALGQDVKLIKDMGLASMVLCGLFIAVILVPILVQSEIESQSLLTVLSKPVSRTALLAGRFLGLEISLTYAIAILSFVLFATVWLKNGSLSSQGWMSACAAGLIMGLVIGKFSKSWTFGVVAGCVGCVATAWTFLDAAESAVAMLMLKGTCFCFLEVTLIGGIVVALANFLKPVPCLFLVAGIFLLGNLAPYLQYAAAGAGGVTTWITQIMYIFVPDLASYNIGPAVAMGQDIPLNQLALATAHTLVYTSGILMIGIAAYELIET